MTTPPKKRAKQIQDEKEDRHFTIRRLWILEQINQHGFAYIDEIKAKHFPHTEYTQRAKQGDLDYFAHSHDIRLTYGDDEGRSMFCHSEKMGFGVLERAQKQSEEKALIAEMAMGFILGPQVKDFAGLRNIDTKLGNSVHKLFKDKRNKGEEYSFGVEMTSSQRIADLGKKLNIFWEQYNRDVVIDAGTTNWNIAKKISALRLPEGNLNHLNVTTNHMPIFSQLAPTSVGVRARMIGGMQVGHTHARAGSNAIAGFESMSFIRNLPGLKYGMAILGATGINVQEGVALGFSYEEAELKGLLFERSAIRVIVADHSKFFYGDQLRSATPYIKLTDIDLIITNTPEGKTEGTQNSGDPREFSKMIEKLRLDGVPVIQVGKDWMPPLKKD